MDICLELIRYKKLFGQYRGFWEAGKGKLEIERQKHAEALAAQGREHANALERQRQELTREFRETLDKHRSLHQAKIDALKAKIVELCKELEIYRDHSRGKSERTDVSLDSLSNSNSDKKRGQQRGSKGHGRRTHSEVPAQLIEHRLSSEESRCPICGGGPRAEFFSDSEAVSVEIKVVRHRHRVWSYKHGCNCPSRPQVLSGRCPLRAMRKSKYEDNFWISTLLFKYHYQIPITRYISFLESHGLESVSAGTLFGGIKICSRFFQPLYSEIASHIISQNHLHADESSIKVFDQKEHQVKRTWYFWQFSSCDAVIFHGADNRSSDVPRSYLKLDERLEDLTLSCDRFSSYKALKIALSHCWAHARRDFIKVGRYVKGNRTWACKWLGRIRRLYRLNRKRLGFSPGTKDFVRFDTELRTLVGEMNQACVEELSDPKLKSARKKVVTSLQNHWQGLTVFVDNPPIPMDNNHAERLFRALANFRKSSYGVFSKDFVSITAMMLSIFGTLKLNRINPRRYLTSYFQAVAENNGKAPSDLTGFLPWNWSSDERIDVNDSS